MAETFYRLQIFDDGAGEYIFDQPANSSNVTGSGDNSSNLSGHAVGPFILPSPLPICKPGLLTVSISNVNLPVAGGIDTNPDVVAIALVFAVPKKCKGICYGGEQGRVDRGILQRRGVLS